MNKSILMNLLSLASIIIVSGCDKKVETKIEIQQISTKDSQIDTTEVVENKLVVVTEPSIIEKTLSQIDSLKKYLFLLEKKVEKELTELSKTNPILADKDQFESSEEYAIRVKKQKPIINEIRNQYCNDTEHKLSELRETLFASKNIDINLGTYNPDSQKYPITVKHFDYPDNIIEIDLSVKRDIAKLLFQNWSKVDKKIFHSIGYGDKISVSEVIFIEPNSGIDFHHNIPQLIYSIKASKSGDRRSIISPNREYLAIWRYADLIIIDLKNNERNEIYFSGYYCEYIRFSTNSKYIFACNNKYSLRDENNIVYNLKNQKHLLDCPVENNNCYSKSGKYLFTIADVDYDMSLLNSGKYLHTPKKNKTYTTIDLASSSNDSTVDVYRILTPTNYRILKVDKLESEKISKQSTADISNSDIKSAVRDFCYPLTCSNWSIGNPKDADGEPNYAVQVFCDCKSPNLSDYVLKAHFFVLISKSTLKPVKVIDVNE